MRWYFIAGICAMFGSAVYLSACDAGGDVYFQNGTEELLFVSVNGSGRDELPPRERTGYGYVASSDEDFLIEITDANGCLVWSQTTKFRNVRGEQNAIVISPSLISPASERTDC
jgi:hypothetical protein